MKRSPAERHTWTRKLKLNVSTITHFFLDQRRVNVCEHTVKKMPRDSFRKVSPEWVRDRKGETWRG
jgi:hypothetical protein